MIAHCVFLNFAPEHGPEARAEVLSDLAALQPVIDGMEAFHHGPNRDFEAKTPDHKDGFIALFRDREALRSYDQNPRHKELGARLVSMCVGGADGILVYDIDTGA